MTPEQVRDAFVRWFENQVDGMSERDYERAADLICDEFEVGLLNPDEYEEDLGDSDSGDQPDPESGKPKCPDSL